MGLENIEDLFTEVQADRPEELAKESEHWREVGEVLTAQSEVLRQRIGAAELAWESRSGTGYIDKLRSRARQLSKAAEAAETNADSWMRVAETASRTKSRIVELHEQWQREKKDVKGDRTQARQKYDQWAMQALTSGMSDAEGHARRVESIDELYQPMIPVTGKGDGGGSGGGPASTATGSSGAASPRVTPAADAPLPAPPTSPTTDLHSPVLQSGAPAPAVATAPVVPPVNAGPPPPSITPVPPPPGPLSASPVTPGGGRVAGSVPTTRAPIPRPPQSTVRPVIGARPGTTGTAPARPGGPVHNALARPVIGTRPGVPHTTNPGTAARSGPPVPGATSRPATRPLIGRDGVVPGSSRPVQAVRVPRTQNGGASVNRPVIGGARGQVASPAARPQPERDRETGPEHRDEGGDLTWQPDVTVVPAVIRGGTWAEFEHAATGVPAVPKRPTDEAAVVDRFSSHVSDRHGEANPLWNPPVAGRGVITRAEPESGFERPWR